MQVSNYKMHAVKTLLSMETIAQPQLCWTVRPVQNDLNLNLMAGINTLMMHEHNRKRRIKKGLRMKNICSPKDA